jgi:phenylacetate-CoA ligase
VGRAAGAEYRGAVLDLYGPLLGRALFPAFEALRGRPTVPLLRQLIASERRPVVELRELQVGLFRRLIRHAYHHTLHYREQLDDRSLTPTDFDTVEDLARLPLLERPIASSTLEARTAWAPPRPVVRKTTSGTTGQPVTVLYNAESRHWRDAIRWRGYGWSGYRIGQRAFHYWGAGIAGTAPWWKRQKIAIDHALKRDHYVDCTPRSEAALTSAVAALRRFRPEVMVAYTSGAAVLARFVNDNRLRSWDPFPVLCGAERLWPHDRAAIEQAFGPAFETYGCREMMLIGSECERHEGLHTSMENLIVELIVREPGGATRAARPGETGEVVVTDLHNLACPMIRYVTGDLAVAHGDEVCGCGRTLVRIRAIEGRVTETLVDGRGQAVGGLVFSILFAAIGEVASHFQVVQRKDRSVVLKVVPRTGDRLPPREHQLALDQAARYLPGVPFAIEIVAEIPLSPAGKRRIVIVEK